MFVVALTPIIFSVYLLLWITSFYDIDEFGDEAEIITQSIYGKIVNATIITGIFVIPFAGWISDRVNPAVVIPAAFMARAIIIFLFIKFVTHPDTW